MNRKLLRRVYQFGTKFPLLGLWLQRVRVAYLRRRLTSTPSEDRRELRWTIVRGGSRLRYDTSGIRFAVAQDSDGFEKGLNTFYCQEEVFGVDIAHQIKQMADAGQPSIALEGRWVSLLSPVNANWMHWLSETLPALATEVALGRPVSGILIDDFLSPQAADTIRAIAPDLPVVMVGRGQFVRVESVNNGVPGWSLVWTRDGERRTGIHRFDADALISTRNALMAAFPPSAHPRINLVLQRTSRLRPIQGLRRMYGRLLTDDYIVASPGELSLQEQIDVFSRAEVVVAQAGAELAGAMFMQPGARILAFCADVPEATEDYFGDYCSAFGVEIHHVRCKPALDLSAFSRQPWSPVHPMNTPFRVRKSDANRGLAILESAPVSLVHLKKGSNVD